MLKIGALVSLTQFESFLYQRLRALLWRDVGFNNQQILYLLIIFGLYQINFKL